MENIGSKVETACFLPFTVVTLPTLFLNLSHIQQDYRKAHVLLSSNKDLYRNTLKTETRKVASGNNDGKSELNKGGKKVFMFRLPLGQEESVRNSIFLKLKLQRF